MTLSLIELHLHRRKTVMKNKVHGKKYLPKKEILKLMEYFYTRGYHQLSDIKNSNSRVLDLFLGTLLIILTFMKPCSLNISLKILWITKLLFWSTYLRGLNVLYLTQTFWSLIFLRLIMMQRTRTWGLSIGPMFLVHVIRM